MTKTAAAALSAVWVPYYTAKGKTYQANTYKVIRIRGGFIVAGTRGHGTYTVTEHPDGFLACPCEGYAWSIEKNPEELPAYCRHLICVAFALVEIAEIRGEATDDEPAPAPVSRRASVPMVVDFDPFNEAA